MHVGSCVLVFRLRGNDSLKGKRQIARSLIAQLRQKFNLSVAEMESMDEHQRLVIGMACVSNSPGHVEEMLDKAVRLAESQRFDAELVHAERDLLEAG
jgi:hypothetical protein